MFHFKSARSVFFALAVASNLAGAARADPIRESNYQQIDPRTALYLKQIFEAHLVRGRIIRFEGAQVAADLVVDMGKGVRPRRGLPRRDTIVLMFDDDICAIGFQLTLPPRAENNSIPVEIRFVSRDGEVVDLLTRQPALGTTRQAYSSNGFDHRFAALQISAQTVSEMAVADIKALPCSLPIS